MRCCIPLSIITKKEIRMKRLLFLFAFLVTITTAIDAVKIGNLYYKLNSSSQEATVTYDDEFYYKDFSGSLVIPEKVNYGGWTYTVTTIGKRAFEDCRRLTSVTIPNSVTSIGEQAFYGCSGLTSVTIGNSVTSIGDRAFLNCDALTSVYITDLEAWCNVDFEDWDSNPLSYAHHLYLNNQEIKELKIPEFIKSIKNYAFYRCRGLTSVTIPNSVTSIGDWAFSGCSGLSGVTIGNSVISIGDYAFSSCSGLTSVEIPNSVTSIGEWAFDNCSWLTSVTIGNSVTSIGRSAFSDCNALTSVYITDLEAWCKIDFEVYIDVDFKVGYSNPLFYAHRLYLNKQEVKELKIPESIKSIKKCAFFGCSGLTSVTIPNSVTSIGDRAFEGCNGLTSVEIPNSVTSIGSSAFRGCSGLTGVTIPNSVTSIGAMAFYGCSGLTSVEIPNSISSIGGSAFSYCSGLTSVTIPKSVTSIGDGAFGNCSGLKSITINSDEGLTLGEYAFCYGCDGVERIYCNSQIPPTSEGNYVFYEGVYLKAIVYVPQSALSDYKITYPWNRFSNIVGFGDIAEVEIHFEGTGTLKAGETLHLRLSPNDMPDNSLPATWSSSNPAVASVSENGVVTGVSAGTCRITATYGDAMASCEVTVLAGAGVNDIFTDAETFTIFTINGVLVKKDASAEDVDALSPGLYIVNGKKVLR